MAVFFISDIHVGHDAPDAEAAKLEKLESFFESVSLRGEFLYILGDLFDFWFEYRHAMPKEHLRVLFMLKRLSEAGVRIRYVTGNHDFWLGDLLSDEIGIEVYRDATSVEHEHRKIFVIHGDGLARSDRGYRILKRILRNRFNIGLYRLIPPDIGIPIAKWCSRSSRGRTSARPRESFLQEYRDWAAEKLGDGYDCVMIGHTHNPEKVEFDNGVYINTGDWFEHFSYATLENGEFTLNYWH